MAFYQTVKLVRPNSVVIKHFNSNQPSHEMEYYIRRALKMPATIRVEVEEEDTQLYAFPPDKRHYPHSVHLKDGRVWRFYGIDAVVAYLQ